MLESWKFCFGKKTLISILLFMSFGVFYIYTAIIRIKEERDKIIKDYDLGDNFTNYLFNDEDPELGIQKYIANVGKIMTMRNKILDWNKNLRIDIKQEIIEKVPLIIVVQSHNRPLYLLELFKSLQKVLGIMNTILVVSHDVYDAVTNDMIRNVQFVTIVQIFYPYSKQLHPNVFPGDDKKYCMEGWRCKKAKGQRNSTLAQYKHHWWWTVNFVFEKLDQIKFYDGLVVFLEEDQFLTEDFMYVLKILDLARKSSCHRCDMVSVGAYAPVLSKYNINSTLVIEEFGSTPLNTGIAFNRTTWNQMKKLSHHFCYYNDYDWVSSMRFSTSRLPEGKMNMLSIAGSRVINIGRCGEDMNCDINDKINAVYNFVELVKTNLYPKSFVIRKRKRYTKVKKNGFFSDVRDHELCMYFLNGD